MQIVIGKPRLAESVLLCSNKGLRKGAFPVVYPTNEGWYIEVKAWNRIVGKFWFVRDEDRVVLDRRRVIERDFFPEELSIVYFVKYLKQEKLKYLLIS